MDCFEEFGRGLKALREYLDEYYPDWHRAGVSVEIEPHHARMVLNGIELMRHIENIETTMSVGTLEDLQ